MHHERHDNYEETNERYRGMVPESHSLLPNSSKFFSSKFLIQAQASNNFLVLRIAFGYGVFREVTINKPSCRQKMFDDSFINFSDMNILLAQEIPGEGDGGCWNKAFNEETNVANQKTKIFPCQ